MGVLKVKGILDSKAKPRSHLNSSPTRLRSRPRHNKHLSLKQTHLLPLPFSLPLIANTTRRRATRRERPTAASFFQLYESDGQPSKAGHPPAQVAHVSAAAGSTTLEDDVKHSRVLSLLAEVTNGRVSDVSFFGTAHAGAEEIDGIDDLPDYEDDNDTSKGADSSYETTVPASTPAAFVDVTPTIKLEAASPTLAFSPVPEVDVDLGNCGSVVHTLVTSVEKTPRLSTSPVKVKVEEKEAILFPINDFPREKYSPPPSPSPVRRETELVPQSLDVLLHLANVAAVRHGIGIASDLAVPEIEMADADSIVLNESAQQSAFYVSPSTARLPQQLDYIFEDYMEDVEYAPRLPCHGIVTNPAPLWSFRERDPAACCIDEGDELFGQHKAKFDGLEGYDDEYNTNMDEHPVIELFARYFDRVLRLDDTVTIATEVPQSVSHSSDNAEENDPIPNAVIPLDELSAPSDATGTMPQSLDELPCPAHIDIEDVASTNPLHISDLESPIVTIPECQPPAPAVDPHHEELSDIDLSVVDPFGLSAFMCFAPTPDCLAGLEPCPASLINYLDGKLNTD